VSDVCVVLVRDAAALLGSSGRPRARHCEGGNEKPPGTRASE
jgi:hypothetical protein